MVKEGDISAREDGWIKDIFIYNMKNSDIQRKLLTETLQPLEVLNVALTHKKKKNEPL